jgi:hypothetical protein
MLADRIRDIPDPNIRDVFCCLFSGTLEFNNMFASYKGEGTGAVRHMFSHHILKPERMPLEANVWGTPKSSGAFSTLFESRILRAAEYCKDPFEVRAIRKNGRASSSKVFGLSVPLSHESAQTFADFQTGKDLYLSCGDSSSFDLASESVDAVITDPPFFDNVHYSQLADFFYVWQRHILGPNTRGYSETTTRSGAEVQHEKAEEFTQRLSRVWRECHRVLRDNGLLVFTYHHSRVEGWWNILDSLLSANFRIVRCHPIKSEMSVAAPKHQAREPIDIDMILICRKSSSNPIQPHDSHSLLAQAVHEAKDQIDRLRASGRILSRNDVRAILLAQVISVLSRTCDHHKAKECFDAVTELAETSSQQLYLDGQ